jgi:type I restriction enzyme, S subunit
VAAGGEEMNSKWPIVPLSDVLNLAIDSVQVEPNNYYKISGVYSFGRGLLARGPLSGAETTYKVFHCLHENDFVISHLKAWEGALARVTASFDGWFLSPQFSTFQPDPEKLEIAYLEWYCKQSKVWDALRNKARGMGARRDSVLPSQFLALPIPLPPLDEQRRIVARIEELAARIEEARELRRRAVEETEALFRSGMKDLFTFHDHDTHPIGQLAAMKGGGTPSKSNPYYWEGTIPWISPKDMKKKEITDSIDHISEIAAVESAAKLLDPGAVLIVVRGMILARMVPTAILRVPAAINQDMKALIPGNDLLPEYLCGALWAFNNQILELVEKSTHDTRKLETTKILDFRIPVPSLDQQQIVVGRLSELQSKLDALKRHQAETAAALDALLPAVLERAFRGEL